MKKTIYEMQAAELRTIAKDKLMLGAWKATKAQMIEFLERIGYTTEEPEPEEIIKETTAYEIDNPDSDEVTANEVDEELKDEESETEEEEETEEDEPKEVKRPSLRINEITFNGKTQSLRAWAEELEMPWPTLYDRINRNGWSIEEALTIPLGGRRQKRA